jgi:hypothetical protein
LISSDHFLFTLSEKKTFSDKVNCDLVGRHIPLMESADENQTLDFAKHPSLNMVRGKPLTPIQETSNEGHSPHGRGFIIAANVKVASKGPAIIEAVSAVNVTAEQIQISKRERAQSPGGSLKKMNVSGRLYKREEVAIVPLCLRRVLKLTKAKRLEEYQ